jgi:GNAT superfamily N-acetyltransferase
MNPTTDPMVAAPPPGPDRAERGTFRWVPVRRLGDQHRKRVLDHLLALNEEDRALRFGHLASDERLRHYVDSMDFTQDAIFGVFDRSLRLGAMVHLAFGERGALPADTAEFGISILPRMRGRGVGALLFDHAVTLARNRGCRSLLIHLARDNAPMLTIVRQAGATVAFDGSDALATLPLAADTLGSQFQELLGHQAAAFDYRLKLQSLRLAAAPWHGTPP